MECAYGFSHQGFIFALVTASKSWVKNSSMIAFLLIFSHTKIIKTVYKQAGLYSQSFIIIFLLFGTGIMVMFQNKWEK